MLEAMPLTSVISDKLGRTRGRYVDGSGRTTKVSTKRDQGGNISQNVVFNQLTKVVKEGSWMVNPCVVTILLLCCYVCQVDV